MNIQRKVTTRKQHMPIAISRARPSTRRRSWRFGMRSTSLVGSALSLDQRETVVETAGHRSRLVAQLVAVDVNDLVELRVLGRPPHERPCLQIVHLRPADRDDIDRAGLRAARGDAPCPRSRGSSGRSGRRCGRGPAARDRRGIHQKPAATGRAVPYCHAPRRRHTADDGMSRSPSGPSSPSIRLSARSPAPAASRWSSER